MLHFIYLSVFLQRRNAWLRAFRTCSSPTICHHLRLWTCLLACPASSKTPVTCHRPCWMISECARVTPSSLTSCSGRIVTWQDMLRQHGLSLSNLPTSFFLSVQIGAGEGGWLKRCTEGSCQPRYLSDHIRRDGTETCWSHNWGPLPTPWLCSSPTFWERSVIVVSSFKMSFTSLSDSDTLEHILCWEKGMFLAQKKGTTINMLGFFHLILVYCMCLLWPFICSKYVLCGNQSVRLESILRE